MVEHLTVNQEVVGSSPTVRAIQSISCNASLRLAVISRRRSSIGRVLGL